MTQPNNDALAYLALPWRWAITHDAESECWLATIVELPDFFAAGATAGEAALNAREALLSHISGYLNTGTEVPMPAFRPFSEQSESPETEEIFAAA